jgi:hypothetical protein
LSSLEPVCDIRRDEDELDIEVKHDSPYQAACGKEPSMRSLATFCLILVATAALSQAVAGEAETIEAINASSNALDKAYEHNDKTAIKALMTPDHISVTPSEAHGGTEAG